MLRALLLRSQSAKEALSVAPDAARLPRIVPGGVGDDRGHTDPNQPTPEAGDGLPARKDETMIDFTTLTDSELDAKIKDLRRMEWNAHFARNARSARLALDNLEAAWTEQDKRRRRNR